MSEYGARVDDSTVRFERLLPGPIEKVWPWLADSGKRGQWFTSGRLPDRIGEAWEMRYHHADYSPNKAPPPPGLEQVDRETVTMPSLLLAIEPPYRLAFSFGNSIQTGEYSEVDIRLTEQADGMVRLVLTHSRLRNHDHTLKVSVGWHSHLAMLEHWASGRVPPSIWDVWRSLGGVYDRRYAEGAQA
jgi:uncharacterized protein YndB with AHSA1/START domain